MTAIIAHPTPVNNIIPKILVDPIFAFFFKKAGGGGEMQSEYLPFVINYHSLYNHII